MAGSTAVPTKQRWQQEAGQGPTQGLGGRPGAVIRCRQRRPLVQPPSASCLPPSPGPLLISSSPGQRSTPPHHPRRSWPLRVVLGRAQSYKSGICRWEVQLCLLRTPEQTCVWWMDKGAKEEGARHPTPLLGFLYSLSNPFLLSSLPPSSKQNFNFCWTQTLFSLVPISGPGGPMPRSLSYPKPSGPWLPDRVSSTHVN